MFLNWLDLLIGGILLFSFIGAVRNGVTLEIVRLVALVSGVMLGMWQYDRVASYLAPYISHGKVAAFTAFLAIVVGCLIVGAIVGWAITKIWTLAGLRWFDRLLGAGFGLVRGMVVAAALVLGLVAFAPFAGTDTIVAESRLAPWVIYGAHAAAMAAPEDLKGAYGSGFQRVRNVWTEKGARPPAPNRQEVSAERDSPFPKTD